MNEINLLRKVALLSKLDQAELELIRSQMTPQTLKSGSLLEPRELWLIVEGSADWIVPDCAGQELVLETLQPGDHFGELELLAGIPKAGPASKPPPKSRPCASTANNSATSCRLAPRHYLRRCRRWPASCIRWTTACAPASAATFTPIIRES